MNKANENENIEIKNAAEVNDNDNVESSINALIPLREQKILKIADTTYSSKSQERLLAEILAEIKVHNKRMRWFIGIGTLAVIGIFIMLFCLLIM